MTAETEQEAKAHEAKETEIELAEREIEDDKASQYATYAPYDVPDPAEINAPESSSEEDR